MSACDRPARQPFFCFSRESNPVLGSDGDGGVLPDAPAAIRHEKPDPTAIYKEVSIN